LKRVNPVRKTGKGDLLSFLATPRLLDAIPDAIVAVDQGGKILQVNSQTQELFGYEAGELLGNSIEMLVPERYRPRHRDHRADFAAYPKTRRMGAGLDLFGRRRDGSEFPVEISLSPVETEHGILVLSAIRDISDRKAIEEELRQLNRELGERADRQLWEHRAKLASIMDSSEDAIITKDLNGIVTAWNKGAERLYGYSEAEMLGQPLIRILPPDRQEEVAQILERIRRGETVDHHDSIRVTRDGRHLNMSISVAPMRDADGKVVGASAIARDVTAQKRSESQLRQAQKMEAVGRLAGGVAHDFNNILGIITACSELLRDRVHEPAATQYLDNVKRAAERGALLTRQLLAFSRKQVVQPRVFDVNERLKELSKLLKPLMGDDVEIVIPARPTTALVDMDPGHLDQVVLNLAVNSRDAMPRGGKFILETAHLEFDESITRQHPAMKAGKYVLLAASDTGIGMDETTVSRIFEPFFTTKEIGKGTGLGLATVYGIVQQAGGHIWVYSEPGRGTTFKVYLPSAEDKVSLQAPAPAAELALPKRHGTSILLVEDDEIMRGLTRQMLEEQGYTVIEARDGKAAVEAAKVGSRIDLMLADVVMRGMSGPEVGAHLLERFPALKVVYMSGYTGELIAERDALRPDVKLLEKPFTRAALLRIVDSVLG
jgi:PAS domain S-box-containing protein